MSDLLDLAIAAHGGWDHWQHLSKLTASASVGIRLVAKLFLISLFIVPRL
jgi:hypothetical protein